MNRIPSQLTWGTLRNLNDVRHAFDRFLSTDETDVASPSAGQWAPRVDIKEEDARFVILADIPGIDPATIEVSMDKNVLSIKGERVAEKTEQSAKFTRIERAYGSFNRRFSLPESADAEGITASGKHGVLEIVIPKRAQTAPRRIAIDTAH
jgi:HSP20 family protein